MIRKATWMAWGVAGLLTATFVNLQAQPTSAPEVEVDPDDIGGVVEGPNGPEAGVWVLAETDSLPTTFRKVVVTDDRGRFVVPDLPRASYRLWVRGYGLVDSEPVPAALGQTVRLTAVPAPSAREAARVYPPNYWYSLIEVPEPDEFPGTGPQGNGIPTHFKSQAEWVAAVKVNCNNCHQIGTPLTRTTSHLGEFASSVDAWRHRIRAGQRGILMAAQFATFGQTRGFEMFADWTDRIAAGEVPPAPPRPSGVERQVVLSMWEWGGPTSYIHDLISTDKRNPTLNANGMVYGLDFGNDYLTVLDPVEGRATEIKIPVRDTSKEWSYYPMSVDVPSPTWGDEVLWTAPANAHNPMMDSKGRIWMTTQVRDAPDQPAFCGEGSSHPSAQRFPLGRSTRQTGFFDPRTQEFTLIDTCFTTHHLQFAEDDDETLYLSDNGSTGTVGWINTREYDRTGDEARAQGWCPIVVDTNGDGEAGPWVFESRPAWSGVVSLWGDADRNVPADMDLRLPSGGYGIVVNPVDHSVWGALPSPFPGRIVRLDPSSCLAEVYEPPVNNPQAPGKHGAIPRGIDVDRNGVIWAALAGTGHTASFDRSKCRVLNGPTATGQHCPEGWTLYPSPGPQMKGVTDPGSADYHYYNWVDQFNALGLGENIPITNGTGSDSLLALLPQEGQVVRLRVPYPVGFHTRGLDGRIDDPDAGWKGRGLSACV